MFMHVMVTDDSSVKRYLNYACLNAANMKGITYWIARGGSLVDLTPFLRIVVGSNPTLASLMVLFCWQDD